MMKNYERQWRVVLLFVMSLFGITASAAEGDVFTKVLSVEELSEGDEIIFVNDTFAITMGKVNNRNWDGTPVAFQSDSSVVVDSSATVITLEKLDGYWCFHTNQGYICTKTNLKNYSNGLGASATATEETKVESITFLSYNAVQVLFKQNKKKTNDKYRHFYFNYNNGYPIFSCKNVFTQEINYAHAIYIYKKQGTSTNITLNENYDSDGRANATTLKTYKGQTVNSVTVNRKFVADGGWYTLCLPFALTEDDIKDVFKGATFEAFTSVTTDEDGTINLNFEKVTQTEAGKPYLLLPVGSDGENTVENPMFRNKLIDTEDAEDVAVPADEASQESYHFIGNFDPVELDTDGTIRFVGADGKSLKRPNGDGALKGLRAYFKLPATNVKASMAHEGEQTGIATVHEAEKKETNVVFNLNGQRVPLDALQLRHGLYIVNGKKVSVK